MRFNRHVAKELAIVGAIILAVACLHYRAGRLPHGRGLVWNAPRAAQAPASLSLSVPQGGDGPTTQFSVGRSFFLVLHDPDLTPEVFTVRATQPARQP